MTDTTLPTVDFLDPELWRTNPHDVWTRPRAPDPAHRHAHHAIPSRRVIGSAAARGSSAPTAPTKPK